jgi:DNA invertase Pin-like site-specific DNA recombinase
MASRIGRVQLRTRRALRASFISYLRVSTDRQGEYGYGIDAQRAAVLNFLDGGKWQLLGEFVEVESGKRNDRPELAKAVAACKKQKAKLIIARLDRLARNVAFIANLMDGKVDFVCCDMPEATRLTIHLLAAVAEHEMIAKRTRDGLAAARARGVKLGGPAFPAINAGRQEAAVSRAQAIAPLLIELAGRSARAIAAELNARKIATATGAPWSAKTVIRARERLNNWGVYS